MNYKKEYRGWIPTCSGGGLSFTTFGECQKPRAIYAHEADADKRFIISYQKRDLSDFALPLRSLTGKYLPNIIQTLQKVGLYKKRDILKIDTTFWFVCIAEKEITCGKNGSPMTGTVLIFRRNEWRDTIEKRIRTTQRYLSKNRHQLDKYAKVHEALPRRIEEHAAFVVNFKLRRIGDLTVTYTEPEQSDSNNGSTMQKSKHFLFEEGTKDRDVYRLCSQIFFHVKDIAHAHIHHNCVDDSILKLYDITDSPDDYTWRCETAKELLRKLLVYKKMKSEIVCASANGIIPYLRYFQKISHQELEKATREAESRGGNQTEDLPKIMTPDIDLDILESAIKAKQQTATSKAANLNNRLSLTLNIQVLLFTILGIIVTTTGIVAPPHIGGKPGDWTSIIADQWFFDVVNIIATDPGWACAIYAGIYLTIKLTFNQQIPVRTFLLAWVLPYLVTIRRKCLGYILISFGVTIYCIVFLRLLT